MSIKTTHHVTRNFAIQAITKKMIETISTLDYKNDKDLEDLLETILHNGFYNFSIVSKEQQNENIRAGNEDKWGGTPYLNDINNLPEENDAC